MFWGMLVQFGADYVAETRDNAMPWHAAFAASGKACRANERKRHLLFGGI